MRLDTSEFLPGSVLPHVPIPGRTLFAQQVALPLWMADTETFLSSPGCQAPPIVCAQWYDRATGQVPLVHALDLPDIVAEKLRSHLCSFHNLPYDFACIAATWPELTGDVFRCLDENRALCTLVAARMVDISRGTLSEDASKYGLGKALPRLAPECGIDLDKEDPWRMRYGELYPIRNTAEWPAEAQHYARQDARAQAAITEALIRFEALTMPGVFEDVFRKTRAAFWHYLITCWGVRTEGRAVEEYHARVQADWARDREICLQAGLVRPNGTKDTKAAKAKMEAAWTAKIQKAREAGVAEADLPKPVLTDAGAISLNEDACTQVGDSLLSAYQRFGSLGTLTGKIEKLRAGVLVPIQPRFTLPLATGRSSCTEGGDKKKTPNPRPSSYGSQMQNPPAAKGLRECFIARPRYVMPCISYDGPSVLCSVDYDGFELRSWAQTCIYSVHRSALAEVLNGTIEVNGKTTDRDPHTEFAARQAGMDALTAYALRARKDQAADDWDAQYRQNAKIANFGFMSDMGAPRFVDQAREMYEVDIPLATAYQLKAAWKQMWPEAPAYFDWIKSLGDGNPIVSFGSGFIRGGTSYTQRCNHFFQHLAACAAQAAGWQLARECYLPDGGPRGTRSPLYGSRIWAFLHDEFVLEIPEDRAHEAAERQAQVQIEVAKQWMPDLKITATPALMRRWAKKAKTVYKNGNLIPWEDAA